MKKISFILFFIIIYQFLIIEGFAQPVQQEWVRRYDDSLHQNDFSGGVALDKLGNVYVTGWSRYDSHPDVVTTIKYSSDGVQQWVAKYQVNGEDAFINGISVDTSNNVYIVGYYGNISYGYTYILLIKYNSDGIFQWIKNFGDGMT